jgi:hypothetical protein
MPQEMQMNSNLPLSKELLLKLLAEINFDTRYYRMTEAHREEMNTRPAASWLDTVRMFLETSPLEFKYNKREKFFSHRVSYDGCEIGLNIAFSSSLLELILVVKVAGEHIGEPFAGLAREIGESRDPGFSPSPAFPKIPFADTEQLQEALESGLALFEDSRRVILAHLGISLP